MALVGLPFVYRVALTCQHAQNNEFVNYGFHTEEVDDSFDILEVVENWWVSSLNAANKAQSRLERITVSQWDGFKWVQENARVFVPPLEGAINEQPLPAQIATVVTLKSSQITGPAGDRS